MNKKLLSVVLGIVVLFVWYKVISSFFGENIEVEPYSTNQQFANLDLSRLVSNDSVPEPALNYRDPFLGEVNFQSIDQQKKFVQLPTRSVSIKPGINNNAGLDWPSISYHGFVKVHGNESSMIILKINNGLVQISEGEKYESTLLVKKAYRDSILLEMNGERKTFHK